jgi:cytochrome c551/c552
MSRSRACRVSSAMALAVALLAGAVPAGSAERFPGVGRAATPAEIRAWDIDVRPDFQGLPKGRGSVAQGQEIWDAKCAMCHGTFGESNEVFTPLVGGTTAEDIRTGRVKSLTDPSVARTTFMKLSTVSTLWDYVRRAMPWNAPKSLSVDEVYAVVAYLLNLADIVPADFVLSDANMAEVQARLPNRNGMTRDHGLWDVRGKPDVANVACMKDCPVDDHPFSTLPPQADGTHGNLAEQNRPIGPVRGNGRAATAPVKVAAATAVPELARRSGCMACHAVDRRLVGPSFHDVAARYRSQPGAAERLATKVRQGGSGEWGSVPMPAHGALSESDAQSLVRWILGLAV